MAATVVTAQNNTPHGSLVTASLSTTDARWDTPFTVVVQFTITPGWHLYWSNPGDEGLPPSIRWSLPEGFRAELPQFPTPEKIVDNGIIAYGYHHELILLTTVVPPPGFIPSGHDTVRAELEWFVCSTSCLTGDTTIALPFAEVNHALSNARRAQDRFALSAPEPWSVRSAQPVQVRASRAGSGLSLHVHLGTRVEDFYPNIIQDAVVEHDGITIDEQGVTIPLHPSGATSVIRRIDGIAIVGGKGYRVEAPVHYTE
jgi:thiol:disulfide interchange protein DsbD